jgi:hypothetical protein
LSYIQSTVFFPAPCYMKKGLKQAYLFTPTRFEQLHGFARTLKHF